MDFRHLPFWCIFMHVQKDRVSSSIYFTKCIMLYPLMWALFYSFHIRICWTHYYACSSFHFIFQVVCVRSMQLNGLFCMHVYCEEAKINTFWRTSQICGPLSLDFFLMFIFFVSIFTSRILAI